jgi:hypothetical protein
MREMLSDYFWTNFPNICFIMQCLWDNNYYSCSELHVLQALVNSFTLQIYLRRKLKMVVTELIYYYGFCKSGVDKTAGKCHVLAYKTIGIY